MEPSKTGMATTRRLRLISESELHANRSTRFLVDRDDRACAAAQEWAEYVSTKDGFKINFPGQPKITDTTWTSQMEYTLPGARL